MGNQKKATAVEEKAMLLSRDEKVFFVGRLFFVLPSGAFFGVPSSIVFIQPLFILGSGEGEGEGDGFNGYVMPFSVTRSLCINVERDHPS